MGRVRSLCAGYGHGIWFGVGGDEDQQECGGYDDYAGEDKGRREGDFVCEEAAEDRTDTSE